MAKLTDLGFVGKELGEPGTAYEDPKGLGEFECENCKYYSLRDGSCGQKDMMRLSKKPRLPNGRVKTSPEGCCKFVDRVGRTDNDED